eukprot:8404058-Alexandrium_andersonii.AAC.1
MSPAGASSDPTRGLGLGDGDPALAPDQLAKRQLPEVVARTAPPPALARRRLLGDTLAVGVDVGGRAWGGTRALKDCHDS